MNTIEAILHRKSTRVYQNKPLTKEDIHTLLEAAMAGPSAVNARPFQFLVVESKETLHKMAEGNGRSAEPLKGAACAIMVLGDMNKVYPKAKDYWVIDCAIAGENITLAAEELGIGCCWIGTYPQENKVKAQRELFQLPENLIPHSIFALGYKIEEKEPKRKEYDASIVHFEEI